MGTFLNSSERQWFPRWPVDRAVADHFVLRTPPPTRRYADLSADRTEPGGRPLIRLKARLKAACEP